MANQAFRPIRVGAKRTLAVSYKRSDTRAEWTVPSCTVLGLDVRRTTRGTASAAGSTTTAVLQRTEAADFWAGCPLRLRDENGEAADTEVTAFAVAYAVSGSGVAGFDGTYLESGTYGGQAAYTDGAYWLWWDDAKWVLSAVKGTTEIPAYTGGASLPGTWTAYSTTTAPAPTVVGTRLCTFNEVSFAVAEGDEYEFLAYPVLPRTSATVSGATASYAIGPANVTGRPGQYVIVWRPDFGTEEDDQVWDLTVLPKA
jgi:hypothetical protein